MRNLALLTFFTLVICIVARQYSSSTDAKIANVTTQKKSVFEMKPEQAKRALAQLKTVAKKPKVKSPPIKTREVTALKKVKRAPKKVSLKAELTNTRKLKREGLHKAFLAEENNLELISNYQSEINLLNERLNEFDKNTEGWSPLLVYYFLINENFTLKEIDKIKDLRDLGYEDEDIREIHRISNSDNFFQEILKYKRIDSEDLDNLPKKPYQNLDSLDRKLASMAEANEQEREASYRDDEEYEGDPETEFSISNDFLEIKREEE